MNDLSNCTFTALSHFTHGNVEKGFRPQLLFGATVIACGMKEVADIRS